MQTINYTASAEALAKRIRVCGGNTLIFVAMKNGHPVQVAMTGRKYAAGYNPSGDKTVAGLLGKGGRLSPHYVQAQSEFEARKFRCITAEELQHLDARCRIPACIEALCVKESAEQAAASANAEEIARLERELAKATARPDSELKTRIVTDLEGRINALKA